MIKAKITDIQNCENLHIVTFDFNSQTLVMMSLELSEDIKIGANVQLNVKATQTAVSKEYVQTSHSNVFKATVKSIDNGKLCTCLLLELSKGVEFEALITRRSSDMLKLAKDDEVYAMIKASDISIVRVLD